MKVAKSLTSTGRRSRVEAKQPCGAAPRSFPMHQHVNCAALLEAVLKISAHLGFHFASGPPRCGLRLVLEQSPAAVSPPSCTHAAELPACWGRPCGHALLLPQMQAGRWQNPPLEIGKGLKPGAVESSCCGGSRPRWWLQPRTAVPSHAAPRSDAPALPEQRPGREIRKRFLLLIKEFATVKGRQKHS